MIQKYLYGHDSQETSYVVDGYPWGFRLRTQKRYWIETSTRRGGGQRMVSQTLNPKTGRWCAVKKGTYSPVLVMGLDENGHVVCVGLSYYGSGTDEQQEKIKAFAETHKEYLSDYQKKALRLLDGYNETYKHVTCEVVECPVGPVSLFSQSSEDIAKREEIMKWQEKRKTEREESERNISKAVRYHTIKSEVV